MEKIYGAKIVISRAAGEHFREQRTHEEFSTDQNTAMGKVQVWLDRGFFIGLATGEWKIDFRYTFEAEVVWVEKGEK
jgi:hypothetical protein